MKIKHYLLQNCTFKMQVQGRSIREAKEMFHNIMTSQGIKYLKKHTVMLSILLAIMFCSTSCKVTYRGQGTKTFISNDTISLNYKIR